MTPRQTEFTSEPYFWGALKRKIADVLSGRITLRQLADWLDLATVADRPIENKRKTVIHGGLKLILFARRGNGPEVARSAKRSVSPEQKKGGSK